MSESDGCEVVEWRRFSQWIRCVCVVTFDLELGQALEGVFPQGAGAGAPLAEQEKANVCYLAFPDSNSGCMGDTRFHVRLRTPEPLPRELLAYNDECPVALQADATHCWGFVYFRQVKEPSLPRGYLQKSVVVLTRLPFINLMYKVCGVLAPLFFEYGEEALVAACRDIDRWPEVRAGTTASLPLAGVNLHCHIPSQDASAQEAPKPAGSVSVSTKDIHPYASLSYVLSDLHLLWELVLTAEPIVVMASSPTVCSAMVQALIDLIHPLRYCAEFRPYFTIHDSEFKEFTKKQYNPPYVILGVTNPFFSKTLHHWPHTVKIDENAPSKFKLNRVGSFKGSDRGSGVFTQYKPYLTKDKTILKRLAGGSSRPSEVQTALVRRHVLELTHSFMIPLERYMASLMPLQKNVSAFRAAPVPRPFNPEDFMNMLQQAGPHLTSGIKGDWAGLYKAFLKSPNFGGWFQRRYGELVRTLQALQLETLASTDLADWAAGRQEVELVDMVLKLRKTMSLSNDVNLPVKSNTMAMLAKKLDDITKILPDDLKAILQNTT